MASIGVFVLKERLKKLQKAAIFIASIGVVWLTLSLGQIPWIGLWLAFTFSIYSLVRKTTKISSLGGLFIETFFLLLPTLSYLVYLHTQNSLRFLNGGYSMDLLLVGCGLATALPLWWFAHAATRMRLASLGLMQYIAPILQFLIGVLVYEEVFSTDHLMGFSMIWLGLILYVSDQARGLIGKHSALVTVEALKNPLKSSDPEHETS
jgi:chloramphenicol-sensitive protein RarD